MKVKTIHKNIADKCNDWLSTITDVELRREVKDHLIVTGGCIASMLLDEKVNDYDVYIDNMDTLKKLVEYYVSSESGIEVWDGRTPPKLTEPEGADKDNGKEVMIRTLKPNQIKVYAGYGGHKFEWDESYDNLKYKPKFVSSNALTLEDDIQLVIRFNGTPEEIHKNFDFIHATNYFTFKEGVVLNPTAMKSLLEKNLYYHGSLYPLTSIIRVHKFLRRQWTISAGDMLKMMYQLSLLNLSDLDTLEEQLTGVDVLHFHRLISLLREKALENPNTPLTYDSLEDFINQVFNNPFIDSNEEN